MKITESRLRKVIRQVICENEEVIDVGNYPGDNLSIKKGDLVKVLHLFPYLKQDWVGVTGIVDDIRYDKRSDTGFEGVCTIVDPSGRLEPLFDCPMTDRYIEKVSK